MLPRVVLSGAKDPPVAAESRDQGNFLALNWAAPRRRRHDDDESNSTAARAVKYADVAELQAIDGLVHAERIGIHASAALNHASMAA